MNSDSVRGVLKGQGWMPVRCVIQAHGLPPTDNNRRQVRDIANELCLPTGNKGYILVSEITDEDNRHSIARLRSQAFKMLTRADSQERAYIRHKRELAMGKEEQMEMKL